MFTDQQIAEMPYATIEDAAILNARRKRFSTYTTAREYFDALVNRADNSASKLMDAGKETAYLIDRFSAEMDMHEFVEIEGGPLVHLLPGKLSAAYTQDRLDEVGAKRDRCYGLGKEDELVGLDLHRGPVFVPGNTLVVLR